MMDWFNANFYKDFGYGFIYLQLYPHHKRAIDAEQAGAISWGKQKALHWLKILDERLMGRTIITCVATPLRLRIIRALKSFHLAISFAANTPISQTSRAG
jgi:hypothetical protein